MSGGALLPGLLAAALLLVLAGAVKLRHPAPAVAFLSALGLPAPRLLVGAGAVLEIAAGGAALAWPRPAAAAVALLYASFAAIVSLQLRRGVSVSCGCFGARTIPPSRVHLWLNLFCTGIACAAVAAPPPAFAGVAASNPAAATLFPATLGAWRGARA